VLSPNSRRPSFVTGFSVLMLQALTTPFVISSALGSPSDPPSWFAGLFLALDLGSATAMAILVFGMRTGRPAARFAPVVLVLPWWIAMAAVAPVLEPATAPVFALCALLMGAASTVTFVRRGAELRFERHDTAGCLVASTPQA